MRTGLGAGSEDTRAFFAEGASGVDARNDDGEVSAKVANILCFRLPAAILSYAKCMLSSLSFVGMSNPSFSVGSNSISPEPELIILGVGTSSPIPNHCCAVAVLCVRVWAPHCDKLDVWVEG